MTRPDHGRGGVEWLDDPAGDGASADDELRLGGRRPRSRRTRVALGVAAAVVVGSGLVVAGRSAQRDPAPGPTVTVAPVPTSLRTFAIEPFPDGPPREALAAIRAAFPRAVVVGFVAAPARGSTTRLDLSYDVRWRGRSIGIDVRPVRPDDVDRVFRTRRTLQLAQQLQTSWVDLTLRVPSGTTAQRDFAALQRLLLDTRLLATR